MPNKQIARAHICNYEGSETKLRGLENKFMGARNKKYEGSEWLLRALGMFLMVLCASFFSGDGGCKWFQIRQEGLED